MKFIILMRLSKKKMFRWGIFVLLLGVCSWLVPSCLTEIDVRVADGEEDRLVVQGRLLVGDPARIEVQLSRLFDFTAASRRSVSARYVKLLDEDGNSVTLKDEGLGAYSLDIPADNPDFQVQLNKSYHIEFETFDGRTFRSDPEKGLPVPEAEGLSYEVVELPSLDPQGRIIPVEHVQFRISTPVPEEEGTDKPYLRWETEWTFKVEDTPFQAGIEQKTCYVTQPLLVTTYNLLDANTLTDAKLEDFVVAEKLITGHFSEGLYFTAIQESLTETAFDYFDQVLQNTERTGSMFETPPGQVSSNIRNVDDEDDLAFGFFYVTQHDTIRTYVQPEDVGSPPKYCPPPGGLVNQSGNCTDFICCDCASVENSTTRPPAFWEE